MERTLQFWSNLIDACKSESTFSNLSGLKNSTTCKFDEKQLFNMILIFLKHSKFKKKIKTFEDNGQTGLKLN